MTERLDFSPRTLQDALERQGHRCGACGIGLPVLGWQAAAGNKYGEGAQGHHIVHAKAGGTNDLKNCVILCQSCHYSAHEGGNYRFGSEMGRPSDFPYLVA